MIPTKIAIATWPSNESRMLPAIVAQRTAYINTQVANGLTDGIPNNVSETVTTRTWLDQASAEAWRDFIVPLASSSGYTVTVEIQDIV